MDRRHNGFTLLELLAAIAIITILVGMLAFAGRHVINSGKERTTRGTLGNLLGMVTEYDLAGAKDAGAPASGIPAVIGGPYPVPGAVFADLRDGWSPEQRSAILLTRSYLSLFRRVPANADAFGKLPADQIVKLPLGTLATPADWAADTDYAALDRATYPLGGGGDIYLTTQSHTAADINGPNMGSAPWVPEDQDGVDVLDAWDNPILLVLPGGLSGVSVGGTGGRTITSDGIISDGDPTPLGARPFFASAGPDGDFSTGDDNVYSFEN